MAIAVGGKAFPWPREGQKELEDTINVYIAEGDMVISVGQGNTRWLTDDDLIRFTEGITYTK